MYPDKVYDVTLKHPSRFIICGPSQSGKSTFVEKLLNNMKDMFGFYFDSIIYFSGQSFPLFDSVDGRKIIKTSKITPEFIERLDENFRNLIIIDDNMHLIVNDLTMSDLFTKKSHHKNITVIFIVQNLFPKGNYTRDISSNVQYIVLMSNPRERLQIRTLSSQIEGVNSGFILDCYEDATSHNNTSYGYLFMDFNLETPVELRYRTNIFPNEEHFAYIKN